MPKLAVALASLVSFAWIVSPAYAPPETLLQVHGPQAIIVLVVPIIVSLYGLFSEQSKIAGNLLLVFCLLVFFLSGILMGLSYLPAAILLSMPPFWPIRPPKIHNRMRL